MRRTRWVLGASVCALLVACGSSGGGSGGSGASGGNGNGAQGGSGGNGASGGSGASGGNGGSIEPPAPACDPGPSPTVGQAPRLIAELGDRWHESWLASPAVADLDGDGVPEILAARHGLLLGWHLDGEVVFRQPVEGRCWASPVVADLRPDLPGLEVAQASADKIYAFAADGSPLPGFPYTFRGELRSLAAGDIDGDGALELVSVTTRNLQENGQRDILIALNGDGTVVSGFPPNTTGASGCDDACYVYNGYDQNVAIGDVNGDGVSDVFATQDNAYNSLHDGTGRAFDAAPGFRNRTKFLGVRGLHDFAEAQQGYANDEATALQAHHTNTAPAIADLDGDGIHELVFLASVQNAAQDRRELGVALWALRHDGTRPPGWGTPLHFSDYLSGLWDYGETNIVAITNQVTVANIDPDRPGPELIFAGFDGRIHAVSAAQELLFSFRYTSDDDVATGGVVVADLTQDGVPELVFTTYSTREGAGALFILDAGGNLQHQVSLPGRGAMPVPTIADTNGDGTLEIVVSLKDGIDRGAQVLVYEVPGSATNCLLWPTGRGNLRRDGYVPSL
ncbi:MAG: VCBS repeat-containing protein [Polyangiaceae bacterium]|nr:VCBS repeat-containing protein [Polyangiaceae bacterium]MCW5788922.1 VCBS repeat-containing protein [Polyangiaceae bacterium]